MTGNPPLEGTGLSAVERALSIPEILERILSFLPEKARDRIGTLVCKSWHALLCCQHHENHHRYPRHLLYNIFIKQWSTSPQSYSYTHDKTSAIGSVRGGLFDVRFGTWTDQITPPKFEYPDVPVSPKAARKNPALSAARDVFAYPVKPCILQSSQWPTRHSPVSWQHRNDWAYLHSCNHIRGLSNMVPDDHPTAKKTSWLDYLDGLGALQIVLTGYNYHSAGQGPLPASCAAERWHARKDLLAALQTLSKSSGSSQLATNNKEYTPREKLALLELEILYLDLTYPRLGDTVNSSAATAAVPSGASFPPLGNWWNEEPVATGDDYEMFLRPLTCVPGISCHLRRLVLKHLMVWPGDGQSSNRRRKGRRTQRQKKGEGLEDDEGLFPIGPILKTCRQLEELTIEVDDQCAKVRHSDWMPHLKKPKVTLVLFIDGACDQDDGGEMKEPEIVDVSELGDDPDHSHLPRQPSEVLSELRLKKLRLKDIRVPEVVLQSLIRASPSLSDLWLQAPATSVVLDPSFFPEELIEPEPRHDFGPNVSCDQMDFFRDLGAQWPQLTRIHFSKSGHRYTAAQMQTILKAFPNTSQWAIGWKDLGDGILGDGILGDLNRIIAKSSLNKDVLDSNNSNNSGQSLYRTPGLYSNFLTSLDIVPVKDWSPQWGDVIHVFLCEAWHLEYLRAGSIGCYLDNLDLNNVLGKETTDSPEGYPVSGAAGGRSIDEYGDPFSSTCRRSDTSQCEPGPKAVWACRNLKHLQIEFTRRRTPRQAKYLPSRRRLACTSSQSEIMVDSMPTVGSSRRNALHLREFLRDEEGAMNDPEKTSRIIFGYLARFCPCLREVSIHCYELTLNLRGGFTLLTRIKTLKTISIIRFTARFEERDVLPWVIKKRSSSPGPVETPGSLTRGLGLALKRVGFAGLNRPSKIKEGVIRVTRQWIFQQEMRKLRRESEKELRTIFDKGRLPDTNKVENTDMNGGGFSNTKGAHWMCTVPSECYRNLGYLQDVVHVLSDLVEREEPKSDLFSKVRPPFGNTEETWPDLVRLRFIYIDGLLQRRFIGPLLRKHRPELDFEWENWNHDDRT